MEGSRRFVRVSRLRSESQSPSEVAMTTKESRMTEDDGFIGREKACRVAPTPVARSFANGQMSQLMLVKSGFVGGSEQQCFSRGSAVLTAAVVERKRLDRGGRGAGPLLKKDRPASRLIRRCSWVVVVDDSSMDQAARCHRWGRTMNE